MTIETIANEKGTTLKLNGWLDTLSAQSLGTAIEELTPSGTVTVDLGAVEYVASAGIRQIISCYRKAKDNNCDFAVTNVSKEIMGIFKLMALDKKMTILPKEND